MNDLSLEKFKVKNKYIDKDFLPLATATLEPTTTCL